MLKLLAASATNDRSPRYMERALAAIHQTQRADGEITLMFAAKDDQVALFLQFADHQEELVAGPITANYPNCGLSTVGHSTPRRPVGRRGSRNSHCGRNSFPFCVMLNSRIF